MESLGVDLKVYRVTWKWITLSGEDMPISYPTNTMLKRETRTIMP
jgi:hypothetical protein